MKNTIGKRVVAYSFPLLVLTPIIFLGCLAVKKDYDATIPSEQRCRINQDDVAFYESLWHADPSGFFDSFPYRFFIENGVYCSAAAVKANLLALNKVSPNTRKENQGLLIQALTTELEVFQASRFEEFNPDSLIILLQWVDEFKAYEDMEKEDKALYGIVYTHWMNFITNQLNKHYEDKPSRKFDFKFKYLLASCQAKRFSSSIGKSKLEKVVQYVLEEKYGYLFNRFWNSTGLVAKLAFFLLCLLFCIMTYTTYEYLFKN